MGIGLQIAVLLKSGGTSGTRIDVEQSCASTRMSNALVDVAELEAKELARSAVLKKNRTMSDLLRQLTPELSRAAKRRRLGRIVRHYWPPGWLVPLM